MPSTRLPLRPTGPRRCSWARRGPVDGSGVELGTTWGRPVGNPQLAGDYMWTSYICVTTRCRGNCRPVSPEPQARDGISGCHVADLHKRTMSHTVMACRHNIWGRSTVLQ